jgi:ribosomal protein S13
MFLFRDVTLDMRKEIRATLKQIYGIGFLRAFEACSIVGLRYPFSLIS